MNFPEIVLTHHRNNIWMTFPGYANYYCSTFFSRSFRLRIHDHVSKIIFDPLLKYPKLLQFWCVSVHFWIITINMARNHPEVKWIYMKNITIDPFDFRTVSFRSTSNTYGTASQLKRLISGSKIVFDAWSWMRRVNDRKQSGSIMIKDFMSPTNPKVYQNLVLKPNKRD